MKFLPGDTVEIVAPCAWTGEVGVVASVSRSSVHVQLPDYHVPLPFLRTELRSSQQKLDLRSSDG